MKYNSYISEAHRCKDEFIKIANSRPQVNSTSES
jgi:hypothetical protein